MEVICSAALFAEETQRGYKSIKPLQREDCDAFIEPYLLAYSQISSFMNAFRGVGTDVLVYYETQRKLTTYLHLSCGKF